MAAKAGILKVAGAGASRAFFWRDRPNRGSVSDSVYPFRNREPSKVARWK